MDGSNITGGGPSAVNYQTYEDQQVHQATKNLDVKSQDSMDSIATTKTLGANYVETYVNPASKVDLPTPDPKFTLPAPEQLTGELKSGLNTVRESRAELQKEYASTMNGEAEFYQHVNDHIDALTDEQLQEIAYQPGMSSEDIKEQLIYAALHPDVEVPENVRALSDQIFASALTETQQTQGADWTPMNSAWIQDVAIEMTVQGYFNDAVGELPGLTKDEKLQLRFAMQNPEAVDSLPPNLKAIFQQIMGKVMTQAQSNLGVPSTWQFTPSSLDLPTNLNHTFDVKFQIELESMINDGKLTKAEAGKLATLHYNSDANLPNVESLKSQLAEIEGKVLNSLQPIYGNPSGYRPKTNPKDRNDTANVAYQSAFYHNLDNYTPSLSKEAKAAIRAAQGSPTAELPEQLQKASDAVKKMSTAQVADLLGLPDDWSPEVRAIVDLSKMDKSNPLFNAIAGYFQELQGVAKKTVSSLPAGEMKNTYMVFLTLLGETLSKLAETLTVSQVCQANLSKTLSQMKLDTELNKIKKQQDAMKEMQKTQEKGGVGGFLMDMFNWGITLMLWVLCPPLACYLVVDAASRGVDMQHFNCIEYAIEVTNRICGEPLGSTLLFMLMIIVIVLCVCYPIFIILLAPLLVFFVLDLAMGNATIVEQGLIGLGVDEKTAMTVAMVTSIIASIILDIIITIVIEVCTLGMGTEITVALWVAEGAAIAAKIAAFVVKFVVRMVTLALKIISKLGKLGKILAKIMSNILQAMVKLAADIADLTMSIIKNIKKLMKAMDELTEVISDSILKRTNQAEKLVADLVSAGLEKIGFNNAKKYVDDFADDVAQEMANNAQSAATRKADYKAAQKAIDDNSKINFRDDMKNYALNKLEGVSGEKGTRETDAWMKNQQEYIDNLGKLKDSYKDYKAIKAAGEPQERIAESRAYFDDLVKNMEKDNAGLARSAKARVRYLEADADFQVKQAEVKSLREALTNLADGVNHESVFNAYKAAKEACAQAGRVAEGAFQEMMRERYFDISNYLLQAKAIISSSFQAVVSMINAHKNYLNAQLAMMKAEIDAYITMVDYMIKMLTDIMNRLMNSVSQMGEDISAIGTQLKQIYGSNSQTMTNLSMA